MLSLRYLSIPSTINIRFPNKVPLIPLVVSEHWPEQSTIRHGPSGSNPTSNLSKLNLKPELMPKHIAVIMDGNRRWAKSRGLPVPPGHRTGGQAMKQLALNCKKFGIQAVTVFAFSSENWVRPMLSQTSYFLREDLRVSVLGNRSQLPESLQNLVSSSEELAKSNKLGMRLIVACNYNGHYNITQATKSIATMHLQTNGIEFPNPDLLIRTSGELRVSNFMLWLLAYTELLFFNNCFLTLMKQI
ncbi:cis-prenyltransferase [Handroanthus impetiginosus]|uniref:Alkyl transferase n=1 Tax=Handroanthus impetiginosus TaxID=429701 RepID=A0A2G9HPS7_9LAMI|nr:cis-prenyltransferase [Handroanthus impetiginosus]